MRTTLTARHCEIPEDMKERTETLVAKLAKAAHRPQRAEVVFDADHGQKVVELHLYLPRGQVKVATGEAADFRTALDSAVAKMRNQLDKEPRRPARRSSVT
jgi:ribosomal subunit interface protein